MIFKTLTLENFRVFSGSHKIELAPRRDGLLYKPVVLFGGLNGAGKTSILAAIRIALLGRRAVHVTLNKKDYQQHLNEQINSSAFRLDKSAIATIKLEFTHTHQGEHSIYIVERAWSSDGDEQVRLYKNSEIEKSLNDEQVQSFLHELVPPGIGDLFFFDGEKIAALAEDDTGAYLKEAVEKLLGIDVINRLKDDLDIYIKQTNKNASDTKTKKLISELESEKASLLNEAHLEREHEAVVKTKLVDIERQVRVQEQKIQDKGGAWATTKNEEKNKAEQLIQNNASLESQILRELDGVFPIALAPKAMAALIETLENEEAAKEEMAFYNKLNENLPGLDAFLATQTSNDVADISSKIKVYFDSLASAGQDSIRLDVSRTEFATIKAQVLEAGEANQRCSSLSNELKAGEESLESLSINIERAPDEAELSELYEKLRLVDNEKHKLSQTYVEHLKNAKGLITRAFEIAKRLEKLYVSQKTEASVATAIQRVDSTNDVLDEFSQDLTAMRVRQLEELFTSSYRKLARKEDLKLSAKIEPSTFDVTLFDDEGRAINRKSMSAGEKQIFAFAVLEALGKLSGKVLPVVIDTPLGRLDSKHRDKLVKHYFPEAGEQVILLSTDTEVDEDFFNAIEPDVSHAYEIEFDQKTRCSSLREGYFWASQTKNIYREVQ